MYSPLKPIYWDEASKLLSKRDPVLKKIIKRYSKESLFTLKDPFYSFSKAIIGQQISVKAAEAIWIRFEKLIKKISPKNFLKLSPDELREIGFSRQKIEYLGNIAKHFVEKKITYNYCLKKNPDELKKDFMAIKGIGSWTYEMFEIFSLNHPDVFPIKDLALLKAVYDNYFHGEKQSTERILELVETWKPFRTVATWYLWRTFDSEAVQY